MNRFFSLKGVALAPLLLLFTAGCSDYNLPDVVSVDAMGGESVVEAIELAELSEDQFDAEMPVDVSFIIHFDETMDFASCQEFIWIEDQMRTPLDVTIEARLEDVTVTLASGDLEPGQNHTLHIGDDIEDINGWEMINGYDISFYTAN